MRRFFVPPEMRDDQTARIEGPDARHMARVLRMAVGEQVLVFDGSGGQRQAIVTHISSNKVRMALGPPVATAVESPVAITVAQGYLKESKLDAVLRPLTELGVSRWAPFFSERTVPMPAADRLDRRVARWRKIAAESLKQCGRSRFPEVSPPIDYSTVLDWIADHDLSLFFWEKPETIRSAWPDPTPSPASVLIIVGPEGGFSDAEADAARAAGAQLAGMGPRILKADTAAIAALTMVQCRYGDMGDC